MNFSHALSADGGLYPVVAAQVVVIADDHALVRKGMELLVKGILSQVQCLMAGDAHRLQELVNNSPRVDLALVDLNMPGMERGERLAQFSQANPNLPIVVVSALTSPDIVRRVMDIPTVYAFVPKSASPDLMYLAIDKALRREKLAFTLKKSVSTQSAYQLSPRLEEIRLLLRQGMSNKLIANTLGIAEGTVKNHMSEIFKALNVSNRTQAAQLNPELQ
jgi:DNA-binding NarL/FixJ family response regulator